MSFAAVPKQLSVFKHAFHLAAVLQPGKIGAHRAADKHILLKIHDKGIPEEKLLQNRFKTLRLGADLQDFLRNFQHLIDV